MDITGLWFRLAPTVLRLQSAFHGTPAETIFCRTCWLAAQWVMALAATSTTSITILRLMVAARNKAPVWCVRNYSRASCHCIFLARMSMVEGWNGAFSGRRIARGASEPGKSNLIWRLSRQTTSGSTSRGCGWSLRFRFRSYRRCFCDIWYWSVEERTHLADKLVAVHNTAQHYLDSFFRKARLQREGVAGENIQRLIDSPKKKGAVA